MTEEELREAVSALADGELAPAHAERLLDRMREDPRLREQWCRHHQVSAALSVHAEVLMEVGDLAERVQRAVASEPSRLVPRNARARASRRRVVTGAALAASAAALAVVIGLGPAPPGSRAPAAGGAGGPAAPARVAQHRPADDGHERTRLAWNGAPPAVEARLNAYLLNHSEYLAGGVRGMLPYARVVGYGARN